MAVTAALVKTLRERTGAGMLDCKKALVETGGDIERAVDLLREKGIAKAAKKAGRIAAEGLCSIRLDGNRAVLFELNSETDFVAKNQSFLDLLENIGTALIESGKTDLEDALKLDMGGKTLEDVIIEATARIGEKLSLRRLVSIEKTSDETFGAYTHMGGKIVSLSVITGDDGTVAKDIAMHVAAENPQYVDRSQVSESVLAHEREILKNEALNEGKPEHIVDKMVVGRLNKYLQSICLVDQPFVKDQDITVKDYLKRHDAEIRTFVRLEVGEGIEKRQEDFACEVQAQMK